MLEVGRGLKDYVGEETEAQKRRELAWSHQLGGIDRGLVSSLEKKTLSMLLLGLWLEGRTAKTH